MEAHLKLSIEKKHFNPFLFLEMFGVEQFWRRKRAVFIYVSVPSLQSRTYLYLAFSWNQIKSLSITSSFPVPPAMQFFDCST